MREIAAFLRLEFRSLYGVNRFLHTKDRKERRRYLLLAAAGVMVAGVFCSYVCGLTWGLCELGLGEIVPMYLAFLASAVVFIFGVFRAGPVIFSRRSYDLVTAMPVRPGSVVVSRFLTMYAEDLLLTLAIFLPGAVTYGVFGQPGMAFWLLALPGALLLPAIPLVLSGLLGTLVMALTSGMRSKSLVQTVLLVGLVLAVLWGSMALGGMAEEDISVEALVSLAQAFAQMLGGVYPPAVWLGEGLLGASPWGFAVYAALSLGLLTAAVALVARFFHPIMRRLQTVSARHDYRLGQMTSRGLLKALYLREVKRYFSSSIYVANTIVGPILGCIMCVALCVAGPETLTSAFPFLLDVPGLAPIVMAGVFCMMTTTSTAISMEGKQFWVIQSLPVPTKALLDAKILLNLTLMLPFYLVAEVCLGLALRPEPLMLLWQVMLPAVMMVFSVVLGITVNLRFHSFDWTKEEQVVKQSASALLGGFAGLLLAIGVVILLLKTPASLGHLIRGLLCAVLLTATALLYWRNNRADLSKL